MKKLITTIALAIIMVSLTNAQIKKPTVTVNTDKFNLETVLDKGIKIDLKKIKSLEDLDKLNIPITEYSKSQVDARALRTWKITPMRPQNGFLRLEQFRGIYTPSNWYGFINNNNQNEYIGYLQEGSSTGFALAPITLKFTPTQNGVYLLKLPFNNLYDGNPYRARHYIGSTNSIQLVTPTDGIIYYFFSANSSESTLIYITGTIYRSTNGDIRAGDIILEQIQIDQIN